MGFLGAMGGGAYASLVEPTWFEVNRYDVPLRKLPAAFSGFKVAHLTDLHHSELLPRDYLEEAFRATMETKPDLIAITGDFITGFRHGSNAAASGDQTYLDEVCEMIGLLSAPHGVWACLGNHDFWFDRDTVVGRLGQAGVGVLRDANVRIRIGEHSLVLAGFTDLWCEAVQWDKALSGVTEGDCVIGLMHNPDAFESLKSRSVDLILSGHTHGGQVSLPFVGAPVLPIENRRFAQGWIREGGSQMYVNKGLGVIAIAVRFNARPEIAIHELGKA